MAIASGSTVSAAARHSAPEVGVSSSCPRVSNSVNVMSQPAGAGSQNEITDRSAGTRARISAIFAACPGDETKIAAAPESFRMCGICSAGSVG